MKLGKLHLLSRQVLLLGSLLAVVSGLSTDYLQSEERQRRLEVRAEILIGQVTRRVAEYEAMLAGLRGLFNTFGALPPETFHAYINQLHLSERYPGLLRVEYVARVSEPSNSKSALQFIPPAAAFQGDATANGFHLANERLELYTGNVAEVAGFGRVGTVTDGSAAPATGLGYLLPIFRNGAPIETPDQRRSAWLGTIGAWVDTRQLFSQIFGTTNPDDIGLRITLAAPPRPGEAVQHRVVFDSADKVENASNKTGDHAQVVRRSVQSFLGSEIDISTTRVQRWQWRNHVVGLLVTAWLFLSAVALHFALRLRYEQRLDEHERKLSATAARAELAASSSFLGHELKNSLAALTNSYGIVKIHRGRQSLTDEIIDEQLGQLGESLDQITRIVRNVDALSKGLSHALKPEQLAIGELFDYARRNALHQHAGVPIEVDVEPPELSVWADEVALQGVLANLIRNAQQALASNGGAGRIWLRAKREDGFAHLTIRDSGPGFAPEQILFRPFQTSKPDGTGIGLVFCRDAVQRMGGRITGGNREDAPGAEFTILLPIKPDQ